MITSTHEPRSSRPGPRGVASDATGTHRFVGRVLVAFGLFGAASAWIAGPLLHLDLGFLDAIDMAVIAAVTAGVGLWQLSSPSQD